MTQTYRRQTGNGMKKLSVTAGNINLHSSCAVQVQDGHICGFFRGRMRSLTVLVVLITGIMLSLSACAPTYPKEELAGAVKSVCKMEYDMNVDVTVTGETMGLYYPMEGLLNVGMGISEKSWDTISNLLLIASRVVLSTDADIKFYCVITQDIRLPELQVVIIKYVDDVKRGMVRNISRSESFKRTLFSINLTPQATKERSIEEVFNKMGVEKKTRERVLNEFFRSPPTKLTDIGYWRGQFYLKNITMEEFLATQIANRVKLDFRAEKKLQELFDYKTAEGVFTSIDGLRSFLLKFKIADQTIGDEDGSLREKMLKEIIYIASKVVYGYKYTDFNFLILEDQLANVKLMVSEQDVYDFNRKKLSVKEIVDAPPGYFN